MKFYRQLKDTPSVMESVSLIMNQYQPSSFFVPICQYPIGVDVLDAEVGCIVLKEKSGDHILPVVRVCQEEPSNKAGRLV